MWRDEFYKIKEGKMKRSLVLVILAVCVMVIPQIVHAGWSRTYGGNKVEVGTHAIECCDGDFAILGGTQSFGAGNGDIWLLKIDQDGDTLWSKTYGGDSTDGAVWMEETSDSGFVILGTTRSFGEGDKDIWLIKTNRYGEIEWTQTYGGTEVEMMTGNGFIGQMEDGGYIVIGESASFGEDNDLWILITDSLGDTTYTWFWEREPGHTESLCCANRSIFGGYVIVENLGMDEYHYFIELLPDGSERWTSIYEESQGILPWNICYIHPGLQGHLLAGSAYSTGSYGGPAFWFGAVNSGPGFAIETGYYCYDIDGYTNCVQPTFNVEVQH
jgi:hypothetical protein